LIEIGEIWGRHLGSVPFVETMLIARWVAGDSSLFESAVTIAMPGQADSVLVPFGSRPGVKGVSIDSARMATVADEMAVKDLDSFAPSLPLAKVTGVSPLSGELLSEAIAIYTAQAVGAASVALEMALAHAKQREAYGQLIGKFQAVRHRLANMHRDLELARTATVWAAQGDGQGIRAGLAGAKLARQVVEGAMQVFGGMSYTWELGLHYYLRHVLAVQKLTRAAATSIDMHPQLLE
jgi:alkylation response protein AidB-like acyl-CoA dehydrogenase